MRSPLPRSLGSHYRHEGDSYLIEIELSSVRQLFNSLDPAPFLEKDLDDEAESYIVETVREFPLKTPLTLVLHLPRAEGEGQQEVLQQALNHYFDYRHQALGRELRQFLLRGRSSLAIGLTLLFSSIAGYRLLDRLGNGLWLEILGEGLMIGGWVAMWHPIETYLYAWWPLARKRRIYDKLRRMTVEVRERPPR